MDPISNAPFNGIRATWSTPCAASASISSSSTSSSRSSTHASPRSGRNPMLDSMVGSRAPLVVLNRDDLADPHGDQRWMRLRSAVAASKSSPSVGRVAAQRLAHRGAAMERLGKRGVGPSRAIVVGIAEFGKVVDHQRFAPPRRGQDRRSRRRHAAAAVVPARADARTDGYAGHPGSENRRRRRRNGSSPSSAPFRASATTPKRSSRAFHRWRVASAAATRVPDLETLRAARGFDARAAANRLCTTRRVRTSAPSTKARSAASLSKRPDDARSTRKAKNAYERERRRLHRLHRFEDDARARGFAFVGGIDEVGRGPLAGPVVAACVVVGEPLLIRRTQRFQAGACRASRARSRPKSRARVPRGPSASPSVAEIDRLNIYWASVLAMERAIAALAMQARLPLFTDAVRIRSYRRPAGAARQRRRALRRRRRSIHRRKGPPRRAARRAGPRGSAIRFRRAQRLRDRRSISRRCARTARACTIARASRAFATRNWRSASVRAPDASNAASDIHKAATARIARRQFLERSGYRVVARNVARAGRRDRRHLSRRRRRWFSSR